MASVKLQTIQKNDREYLFQNYGDRLPASFVHGKGDRLWDQDGKEYIDFFSGIAVSNLGHGNKALIGAIKKQAGLLLHSSNWYFNQEQIDAAILLRELAFPGKTLFVNSGTEANEAALKLARRYGLSRSSKKVEIISFTGSFHGRTFGSMTATAQPRIHEGFGPLPGGFTYLPFNDPATLKKAVGNGSKTAAIIVEPIQGEGGITIATEEFLKTAAELCEKHDILLIADEIQTGIGRTGKPFALQHYGVTPDILTLAKGLGGGLPVGALHAKSHLAQYLPAGVHGTTFGGNHVVMAAVSAVLKQLKKETLMKRVVSSGNYIMKRLLTLSKKYSIISDIRGKGLHIGIELTIPGMDMVKDALDRGLLINVTAGNVIRIMPPLTLTKKSTIKGLAILEELLKEYNDKQ